MKPFLKAGVYLFTGTLFLFILSCYTLRGYNIDPTVKTFYVGNFKVVAYNAPATIAQTFQEALKDKITRESRLLYSDEEPHLEFNGSIQSYTVTSVAPQPGEQTAFNRLTIVVSVDYQNNLDPKDKWTKTFSHFEDFDTTENLSAVEEELITVIFNQVLEDIFNQAFNNW